MLTVKCGEAGRAASPSLQTGEAPRPVRTGCARFPSRAFFLMVEQEQLAHKTASGLSSEERAWLGGPGPWGFPPGPGLGPHHGLPPSECV